MKATGRGAEARPPEGPHRRCLVTGEVRDRSELLRFVVGPAGDVVPDAAARLPGRGLWLTPRRDIVERAVAKRVFARAAGRAVVIGPGLAERAEAVLVQRLVDAIGLARRAGLAVAGFEKVRSAVRAGKVGLLLAACDGAETGRRKIRALGRDVPAAVVLTAAEMGRAFGREQAVHAAVAQGALCDRVMIEAAKVAGFRAGAAIDREHSPCRRRRGGRMAVSE